MSTAETADYKEFKLSTWKETKRRWKVKRAERKRAEEEQRKRETADRLRAHEDARRAAARQQVELQLQALAAEVTPPGRHSPKPRIGVLHRLLSTRTRHRRSEGHPASDPVCSSRCSEHRCCSAQRLARPEKTSPPSCETVPSTYAIRLALRNGTLHAWSWEGEAWHL